MQAAQGLQSLLTWQSCRIWSPLTPPSADETYTCHFLGSLLLCYHGESIIQHLTPLAQNLRSLGLAERCRQLFTTHGAVAGFTLSLSNRPSPLLKHSNLFSCCWHILMLKSTSPYKLDPASCHGREP